MGRKSKLRKKYENLSARGLEARNRKAKVLNTNQAFQNPNQTTGPSSGTPLTQSSNGETSSSQRLKRRRLIVDEEDEHPQLPYGVPGPSSENSLIPYGIPGPSSGNSQIPYGVPGPSSGNSTYQLQKRRLIDEEEEDEVENFINQLPYRTPGQSSGNLNYRNYYQDLSNEENFDFENPQTRSPIPFDEYPSRSMSHQTPPRQPLISDIVEISPAPQNIINLMNSRRNIGNNSTPLEKVTLDQFLNNDYKEDPTWNLCGIIENDERMRLDINQYLANKEDLSIYSDIDSVIYVGENIPCLTAFNWNIYAHEEHIKSNLHIKIRLIPGIEYPIHWIPNISIGRFGENGIFQAYLLFPRLIDNTKTSFIIAILQRQFYNQFFFPALISVIPDPHFSHWAVLDHEILRSGTTDFLGILRRTSYTIPKQYIRPLIDEIRNSLPPNSIWEGFKVLVNAKGIKKYTKSTEVDTRNALNNVYGFDMNAVQENDDLYIDVGFEVYKQGYTLIWRDDELRVS